MAAQKWVFPAELTEGINILLDLLKSENKHSPTRWKQFDAIPKPTLASIARLKLTQGDATFTLLQEAVTSGISGDLEVTRMLLANGAAVNVDSDLSSEYRHHEGLPKQTPLTYAASIPNNTEMVALLAQHSKHPADALRAVIALPNSAASITQLAAIPEIVRNINSQSPQRPAPLLLAAFRCKVQAFEALLAARNQSPVVTQPTRQKVQENIVTAEGATLLHQAVLGAYDGNDNHREFIGRLVDKDMKGVTHNPWPSVAINAPSGDGGPTALSLACALNKPNIIQLLIHADADINQALQLSSRLGNIDALELLLEYAPDRATILAEASEVHPLFLALSAERQHLLPTMQNTGASSTAPKLERHAKQQWVQVQEAILNYLHKDDQIGSANNFLQKTFTNIELSFSSITDLTLLTTMQEMYNQLTQEYASNAEKIAECVDKSRKLSATNKHDLNMISLLDNSSITGTGSSQSSHLVAYRGKVTNHLDNDKHKTKLNDAEKAKLITENAKILGQLYALSGLVKTCTSTSNSSLDVIQEAKEDFLAFCEHKIYSETNRTKIAMVVGALTGIILGGVLGVIFAILATGGTAAIFVAPTTAHLGAKIGAALVTAAILGVIGGSIGEATENTQVKNWRDHFFAVGNQVAETVETARYQEEKALRYQAI